MARKNIDLVLVDFTKVMFKLAGVLSILFFSLSKVQALEALTTQELASYCANLSHDPQGADGQYCVRYIQGFIDGAIATDARVMLNTEKAATTKETFAERAMRTRMPGHADLSRAAKLVGFCLNDPLPLNDVVKMVVEDLKVQQNQTLKNELAMEAVYKSLIKNYPCKQ